MSKLRVKLKRRKRAKKKLPSFCKVKVPAWLTRCAMMGYEIWSEKPELRDGSFRILIGWSTLVKGGHYLRLPDMDETLMSSPLYLHKGKMRRIWLHLDIKGRKRLTHAETMQATKEDQKKVEA